MKKIFFASIAPLALSACGLISNGQKATTPTPVDPKVAAVHGQIRMTVECRIPFSLEECMGPARVLQSAGYTVNVTRPEPPKPLFTPTQTAALNEFVEDGMNRYPDETTADGFSTRGGPHGASR